MLELVLDKWSELFECVIEINFECDNGINFESMPGINFECVIGINSEGVIGINFECEIGINLAVSYDAVRAHFSTIFLQVRVQCSVVLHLVYSNNHGRRKDHKKNYRKSHTTRQSAIIAHQ